MAESHEDKDFLEFTVKHIVDNPEAVNVDRTVDEMGVLMTLDVHADDMGKVIGRNGNTAKALRTLLRVVGMKNQARVNLKIREPEDREDAPEAPESSAQDADEKDEKADDSDTSVDDAMEELKS
ncbi:MAG: KH domain-containing protein [Candidatus Paceibacterota bacterium]